MHVAPQLPQLRRSLPMTSMQTPPHATWARGHWHAPATQTRPPVQAMPHAPQFAGSSCRLTQAFPHAVVGDAHARVQVPPPQTWVARHFVSQVPQLRGSLFVSTQTPPQTVWPLGH
jgi:hypothetical protein